jgi:putative ubiquitin-RnfH superfamily antitoxin RatB of RatAB toxin-antitoxin module
LEFLAWYCNPNSPVYDGDRIEVYTPILIDPKNARRKKANQTKDAKLKAKAKQRLVERSLRES